MSNSIDDVLEDMIDSLNYDAVRTKIIDFLARNLMESGKRCYIIGLSGGLDSSVTAKLTADMLDTYKDRGRDNEWHLYALIMPHSTITPERDIKDAIRLADTLGIEYDIIPIDDIHSMLVEKIGIRSRMAEGNLLARLRMCLLYYHANVRDALVLGTSDRSEIMIGYYTKYGDGAADLLPIAMLYKSQVRALAMHLMLDESIVWKKSAPMLWQGHYAEDELNMSYDEIDAILYCLLDKMLDIRDIVSTYGIDEAKVKRVRDMVTSSIHKRSMPPICDINKNGL